MYQLVHVYISGLNETYGGNWSLVVCNGLRSKVDDLARVFKEIGV